MARSRLPDMDGYVLADGWSPTLDAKNIALRRHIADFIGLWATCPRVGCQNAGACGSRTVVCFEEDRLAVIDLVWDYVMDGYLVDLDDD